MLLALFAVNAADADCPAAPIGDPNDLAISFLKANGAQVASASLLASSVKQGTLIYDGTANKLKLCDGTNWIAVGTGAGTDTLASLSCTAGEIAKFNGTAWACAASGGGGSTASPSFAATTDAGQALSGGWQKANFATETLDSNNNFAGSRFTPAVAGKYILTSNMRFSAASGFYNGVAIMKNGSEYVAYGVTDQDGIGNNSASVSAIVDANGSSDYFEVYAYGSPAGSSIYHDASKATTFTGSLIGGGGSGSDTLASLSCTSGEVAQWNGTAWVCASGGGTGSGSGKAASGSFGFASGECTTAASACLIDISSGDFTAPPNCTVSMNNFDGTGYSEHMIIQSVTTTALKVWKGQFLNNGTTMEGRWICIQGAGSLGGGADTLAGLSCTSGQIPKWDGSAWACAADGGGGGDALDAFTVTKTSGQALASVGTLVDWQNAVTNVGGHFDLTTDKFTAATAGNYYFHASLLTNIDATNGDFSIFKNGVRTDLRSFGGYENGYKPAVAQGVLTLAAGDTVDLRTNIAGNTLTGGVGTSVTTFTGFRIGGGGSDTLAGLSCTSGQIPKWDGSAWACATDGGGSGGGTLGPAFYVHKNGVNQTSVVSNSTVITWPNEAYDTNNNFASNRFTPTVAGRYIATAQVRCLASNICLTMLRKNGSVIVRSGIVNNGVTSNYGGAVTVIVDMNGSTDYLDVLAYNDSTSTITGDALDTFFMGSMIGGGSDTLAGLSCTSGQIPKWDGSAWACAADGGGGSGGAAVAFSVNKSANQSGIASGTSTTVTWSNKVFDTNNNFDTGTSRFTPTVAGKYLLTASVAWVPPSADALWYIGINKNGTRIAQSLGIAATPATHSVPVTALVDANGSTDYFDVDVYQATGASQTIQWGHSTYFSGALLGGGSDTLAGLSCTSGEIPKWSGSAWACAAEDSNAAGAANEVQFRNSSTGAFDAESSFVYDKTNKRLGIGTLLPGANLDVVGDDSNVSLRIVNRSTPGPVARFPGLTVSNFSGTMNGHPVIQMTNATGSTLAPGALKQGDSLGALIFVGQTSGSSAVQAVRIETAAEADFASGSAPTALLFSTTAASSTNYSEKMRITGAGNVGIGTTTTGVRVEIVGPASVDNAARFVLRIADDAAMAAGVGGGLGFRGKIKADGTFANGGFIYSPKTNATDGDYGFDLVLGSRPSIGNPTERMRITHNGNVGIGTATPNANLHVAGGAGGTTIARFERNDGAADFSMDISAGGSQPGMSFYPTASPSAPSAWAFGRGDSGNFQIGNGAATLYSSTKRLTVDTSGNVGIGTVSPDYKLTVAGVVYTESDFYSKGGYLILGDNHDGDSKTAALLSYDDKLYFRRHTAGTNAFEANVAYLDLTNGNLTAGGYFHTSDVRLKDNVRTIPNALDLVSGLRGVSFDWKADGRPAMGVIAQEVKNVIPQAVSESADGTLAVEYDQIIGPLIEAVKELKADNDDLHRIVEEQGRAITALKQVTGGTH